MVDAGYSGTPLPRKLGIGEASRVLLVNAPPTLDLAPLPAGAVIRRRRTLQRNDVVLLFVTERSALEERFRKLTESIVDNGALWVCWPKRASGVVTDLTENVVREHGLRVGLVDVKVAAIDTTWSGLKFVRRLADRPSQSWAKPR
jgi:hypothetical protein